jgi:sugar O-acyltransferase (sialic acid O-acetyltransferase NeuD family)
MTSEAQSILLVGAGGHARACIDVLESEGRFVVAGLIGTTAEVGAQVLGYAVLGTDADLPDLRSLHPWALVACGQIKTPDARIRVFEHLQRLAYELPVIVSPRAYVSRHALLGAGTIVMHGAVVNAGAVVGRNCIINSQALIEHGASVGDHCHISTAAVLNGDARVGAGSFVGSGAVLRERATVAERSLIGMGEQVRGGAGAAGMPGAARRLT